MKLFQYRNFYITIIFFWGLLIYLPSINVNLLNDEIAFINRTKPESINDFASLFDKKEFDGVYYRPAGNVVSGITGSLFGHEYIFYRLFNLLLHVFNGIIVFLFIKSLVGSHDRANLIALFAALFFLTLPLNDYAVIWHTDLFDRLLLPFYLLSLIYFIKKRNAKVLSLLFFLLALLTKEMAFSLPLIIVLLDFFINKEKNIKTLAAHSAPYFLILFLLIIFRIIAFDNNIFTAEDAHAAQNTFNILKNYVLMGGMLVFPFFLREAESMISANFTLFASAGILIFILIAVYFVRNRRSDYLFIFLILFILLSFLPASRLLMRWYLYLPSVGFAGLLSYFIFTSRLNIRYAVIICLFITGLYASYLLYRESIWISVSKGGHNSLVQMKAEYSEEIKSAGEISFITIPAKVNDIPLFQLGFDHHIAHYLGSGREYNALSKSVLNSFFDQIEYNFSGNYVTIRNLGENYLLLTNNDKNVKFESNNPVSGKLKEIKLNINKEPDRLFFTFSQGKFFLIKDSK